MLPLILQANAVNLLAPNIFFFFLVHIQIPMTRYMGLTLHTYAVATAKL